MVRVGKDLKIIQFQPPCHGQGHLTLNHPTQGFMRCFPHRGHCCGSRPLLTLCLPLCSLHLGGGRSPCYGNPKKPQNFQFGSAASPPSRRPRQQPPRRSPSPPPPPSTSSGQEGDRETSPRYQENFALQKAQTSPCPCSLPAPPAPHDMAATPLPTHTQPPAATGERGGQQPHDPPPAMALPLHSPRRRRDAGKGRSRPMGAAPRGGAPAPPLGSPLCRGAAPPHAGMAEGLFPSGAPAFPPHTGMAEASSPQGHRLSLPTPAWRRPLPLRGTGFPSPNRHGGGLFPSGAPAFPPHTGMAEASSPESCRGSHLRERGLRRPSEALLPSTGGTFCQQPPWRPPGD
ncbi:uncharacterized protein LOC136007552 isoform X1 [Lathamus discolor]|uniref:uncharacterized protein LOC136007552 isoform X1 n=1 Tax=Lathamus discolor TaxID=678569 RepID=UPI0032B81DFB